jgi:hypothetical protein
MLERDQAVLEQSEAELISWTVVVTDREEVLFFPLFLSGFLLVLFKVLAFHLISCWVLSSGAEGEVRCHQNSRARVIGG